MFRTKRVSRRRRPFVKLAATRSTCASMVTDETGWQNAVGHVLAERSRLDILVNNAGLGDLATIEDTSLADWNRTLAIDQTGVFLGMKTCADALKASGHGSVINISSIFG